MGCTPSKESVCRNCQSQCSPVRRSYSSYGGHSPRYDADNHGHHLVALTSTTLGYLFLNPDTPNQMCQDQVLDQVCQDLNPPTAFDPVVPPKVVEMKNIDFPIEDVKTNTWSEMINENNTKNVPKTPIGTPPSEPETINAWELMEGLDDSSPLQPQSTNDHIHCFSSNTTPFDQPTIPSQEKVNLYCLNSNSNGTSMSLDFDKKGGDAKKLLHIEKNENMSRTKERLILYFTSLRGVRKTYEDCCHVQVILKNSGVRVDERDVSMHSGFKEELKDLLSDRYGGGGFGLPKVFIGSKYIGGVDEIRRFNDEFQLDKLFEGCEMVDHGGACEGCGDIRFLPCDTCSGSCKIYYEVNSDEGEKDEVDENDYGFQRCPDCNENGLVKCPNCWD